MVKSQSLGFTGLRAIYFASNRHRLSQAWQMSDDGNIRQSVFKLYRNEMILLAVACSFLLLLAGWFVYQNVVLPWPYRDELKVCLDEAKQQPSEQQIEAERDHCFRTYPDS